VDKTKSIVTLGSSGTLDLSTCDGSSIVVVSAQYLSLISLVCPTYLDTRKIWFKPKETPPKEGAAVKGGNTPPQKGGNTPPPPPLAVGLFCGVDFVKMDEKVCSSFTTPHHHSNHAPHCHRFVNDPDLHHSDVKPNLQMHPPFFNQQVSGRLRMYQLLSMFCTRPDLIMFETLIRIVTYRNFDNNSVVLQCDLPGGEWKCIYSEY
jgi:hypothetical protein